MTDPVPAAPSPQRVVGSYQTYPEAERAVDHLSDQRFPVERIAVVGRGLQMVEQVTGRLTIWSAGLRSAVSGVVFGALFGWLLGIFDLVNPLVGGLVLALYGALIGAVIGFLLGLATHSMTGGRRDFSSITGFQAQSYDLLVDVEVADEAAKLLAAMPSAVAAADRTARSDRSTVSTVPPESPGG
jgi:hypothetical protein